MSRLTLGVEAHVDFSALEASIEHAIRDSLDDIVDGSQREMSEYIESRGAVFDAPYLRDSWLQTPTVRAGNTYQKSVENTSPHASYVDKGVSGVEKRYDTPHAYTNEKPPIEALLPWVREKLSGFDVTPDGSALVSNAIEVPADD